MTSSQMSDLDRKMVDEYHIDLLLMMENAGKALALQARRLLDGSLYEKHVLVLAGKGNNGGGGLASARHMYNWGAKVEVILSSTKEELRETPMKQLQILEAMGLSVKQRVNEDVVLHSDLIIDALLGYNQRGNPKGRIAELIEMANSSRKRILALDVPTGLDPDTGRPNNPCIKATQTLTLALPKVGLLEKDARPYTGTLFVADISVPREIYLHFGMDNGTIFGNDSILEIDLGRDMYLTV